jgi:hypothetical protein
MDVYGTKYYSRLWPYSFVGYYKRFGVTHCLHFRVNFNPEDETSNLRKYYRLFKEAYVL